MNFQKIQDRVAETGLICRGGFHATPTDSLPDGTHTLVLVGDLGGQFWNRFAAEKREEDDPLDNWTRRVMKPVAADLRATLLFPFDQPHWPFQTWAMRAEGLQQSPVGPLIHAEYGIWHSYRAALAFDAEVTELRLPIAEHPCDTCGDKPCLTACPVHAFDQGDFDLRTCLSHLKSPQGGRCMTGGCLARRACPVGERHIYAPDHQAFLAQWFVRAFGD